MLQTIEGYNAPADKWREGEVAQRTITKALTIRSKHCLDISRLDCLNHGHNNLLDKNCVKALKAVTPAPKRVLESSS